MVYHRRFPIPKNTPRQKDVNPVLFEFAIFRKNHTKIRGKSNCFLFLPSHSTHLLQPIDAAFFQKSAWRILERWKKGPGRKQTSNPKDTFSQPLMQLTNQIKPCSVANVIACFEKNGLMPLNKNKVIDHHPYDTNLENTNGESVTNKGAYKSDASFLEI